MLEIVNVIIEKVNSIYDYSIILILMEVNKNLVVLLDEL